MMLTHGTATAVAPKRVVIAGARGFIGSTLAGLLQQNGITTLTLSSAEIDLAAPGAVDMLSGLLQPDDSFVFLAGISPGRGRDIASMMKNLAMAQNACLALTRQPVAHVMYFSSDAVYSFADPMISEATPPSPQDLYGTMHLTREIMFRSSVKGPLAVLRPAAVYGGGDTHNSYGPNRFYRLAISGKEISLFGEGEEQRDHVFVKDVAEITYRCLSRRSGGLLNLATGKSHSFRDVAEAAVSAAGRPVPIKGSPRANPITHRHFDVMTCLRAFPDFHYRSLAQGLAQSSYGTVS